MKKLVIVLLFLGIVVSGIAGLPPLLRSWFGVEQPMMTVISSSMWPALNRGDIIFIMKSENEDIKVGSVIVFRHENGYAVHRVINLDSRFITTRGDANPTADNPILYSDVVGIVPSIGSKPVKIPWLGNIALVANPNAGTVDPAEPNQIDFWEQVLRLFISPPGFVIIVGFLVVLFFEDKLKNLYYAKMPVSVRKRRKWQREQQLKARLGEARARQALRTG